jgi:hypothetical protein
MRQPHMHDRPHSKRPLPASHAAPRLHGSDEATEKHCVAPTVTERAQFCYCCGLTRQIYTHTTALLLCLSALHVCVCVHVCMCVCVCMCVRAEDAATKRQWPVPMGFGRRVGPQPDRRLGLDRKPCTGASCDRGASPCTELIPHGAAVSSEWPWGPLVQLCRSLGSWSRSGIQEAGSMLVQLGCITGYALLPDLYLCALLLHTQDVYLVLCL